MRRSTCGVETSTVSTTTTYITINAAGWAMESGLDKAEALIQYNLFDFNRHSIAGTGRPGTSYEVSYNVELGESLSHCFRHARQ